MEDIKEMSLDEIIKQRKEFQFAGGRRGGRNGPFGRGDSKIGRKAEGKPATSWVKSRYSLFRKPYSRTEDIANQLLHEQIERPGLKRSLYSPGPTILIVSNLAYAVTDSDIQELFSEFGRLKSSNIVYDKTGRSMGSAIVVFERRMDATSARDQYDGVFLDDRPMYIKMTTPGLGVARKRLSGVGRRWSIRDGPRLSKRGLGGGFRKDGGGVGGRWRRRQPAPTAEELDAELDDYASKRDTNDENIDRSLIYYADLEIDVTN